jgi:hypothetical protein
LGEAAEEELFVGGLLEPTAGKVGVRVPAPYQRQPDVGIREIQ